jgi:hypothetical protein
MVAQRGVREFWGKLTPAEKGPLLRECSRALAEGRRRYPGLFSFVYAIQAGEGGPIKIGISDKPWERIETLQQANAEKLIGLAAWHTLKSEEKELHREFAYARIRGEWFRPVPELVELVLAMGGEFCDWTDPAKYDPELDPGWGDHGWMPS